MSRSRCYVEYKDGQPFRILKKPRFTDKLDIREIPRKDAVASIRHQVFERTKGQCEWCGEIITENGWSKMELHEVKFRSQGGEISVENSVGICHDCHTGRNAVHKGPIWSHETIQDNETD